MLAAVLLAAPVAARPVHAAPGGIDVRLRKGGEFRGREDEAGKFSCNGIDPSDLQEGDACFGPEALVPITTG